MRTNLAFLLTLLVSISCSNTTTQTQNQLPDYQNWEVCVGEATKTCFDDNPLLATNGITEYSYKDSGEKALLMWWTFRRSNIAFNMHGSIKSYMIIAVNYEFYKRVDDEWVLVETRSFPRDVYRKNRRIPLFSIRSPFGREFREFKEKTEGKDFTIPTMTFSE